jgi:hypothetical protein
MKVLFLLLLFSSTAIAHNEDLFPDQQAIIRRMDYADSLEYKLYPYQVSISLFGIEQEHLLIISPDCASIKDTHITGAKKAGIMSITCKWVNGSLYHLRFE